MKKVLLILIIPFLNFGQVDCEDILEISNIEITTSGCAWLRNI